MPPVPSSRYVVLPPSSRSVGAVNWPLRVTNEPSGNVRASAIAIGAWTGNAVGAGVGVGT